MKRLGETKPVLKQSVVAVFIASEENSSIPGVGVDMLVKDKLLDKLKSGPLLVSVILNLSDKTLEAVFFFNVYSFEGFGLIRLISSRVLEPAV